MLQFIDVHSHLLNFKFVPDGFFKTRSRWREWMLRRKDMTWIARGATIAMPGKKHDRLHQVLGMMKKDINEVAKQLLREMKQAGILLSTPLMMDLEIASFNVKPECPCRYQVKLISDIAIEHAGRIMPFVMFDPRRESASKAIIEALDEMGFLGVKMYPPLGYHPDPSSFCNDGEVNRRLERIYSYCARNSIPISTHCSRGGAYSGELMRCKECAISFCRPSSWQGVLKEYPNLYLNFAHFGGKEAKRDGRLLDINDPKSWCSQILELMEAYDNVYADVSYHSEALGKRTSGDYFHTLQDLMRRDRIRDRILFGTDWPMTRHTWTPQEYVRAFIRNLETETLQNIAFQNPMNFLFPGRKLPGRIKEFFGSNGIGEDAYPPWMEAIR